MKIRLEQRKSERGLRENCKVLARNQGNQRSWRRRSCRKSCCGFTGKANMSLACFHFLMFFFILCWPMSIILLFSLDIKIFLVVLAESSCLHILLCFGSLLYSWFSPVNSRIHLCVWVWCLIVILLLSICLTSFQTIDNSWNEALPNKFSGLSFLLCF